MLKILRQKGLAKKIFWVIIVVMVVAFILWGAGAYRQSSKTTGFAGEIFARKIPASQFYKLYSYTLNKIRLNLGENYQELLPYLNLKEQTWMQLILLEHARRLNIKVTDEEVIKDIVAMPLFLKEGKFNQAAYKNIVSFRFKIKPRDFEEQIRNELTVKKAYEELTKNVSIADEEIVATYKHEHEAVSVNYIKVEGKDFLGQIQTDGHELLDYYQKNAGQFKREQSVKIEYLGIEFPKGAQEADRLQIFEHMKSLYPKIKNTHELKDAATGTVTYRQSDFFAIDESVQEIKSDEFYKYAFTLSEKETSPLIQAPDGVYVLRVLQKKPSYIPAFDEVKQKVETAVKTEKAKEEAKKEIDEYKKRIDELLKKDPSLKLKEIAKSLNIEVKTSAEFKRTEAIPGIEASQNINGAAFSLKPSQISDIIQADSAFFIIEQATLAGIDEDKFRQEKETYRKNLLERKKQNTFNTMVQVITAEAKLKDYTASPHAE